QMDSFPGRFLQLLHKAVKLVGHLAFGRIFKWAWALGHATFPPGLRLQLRQVFAAAPIDIDMMRNAMNPCRKTGPALVRAERRPDFEKSFLRQVLGILIISSQ